MISYVSGWESEWSLRFNDPDWEDDGDTLYISTEDQCWDKATLQELWDEYRIVFMTSGDGVLPVMIINFGTNNPWFVIGGEDDGTIFFQRRYGQFIHIASTAWIEPLIADLRKAAKLANDAKPIDKIQID